MPHKKTKSATLFAGCFLITIFTFGQSSAITTPSGYLKDIAIGNFPLAKIQKDRAS